jgi:hypothetical protein
LNLASLFPETLSTKPECAGIMTPHESNDYQKISLKMDRQEKLPLRKKFLHLKQLSNSLKYHPWTRADRNP